jgi:hypothetical protein
MQAALEKELEETEAKVKDETAGADADMGNTEITKKEDDSDAGSEDLEAESSSDEEDEEEEEAEADEDMEMADGAETAEGQTNGDKKTADGKQPEVMVHCSVDACSTSMASGVGLDGGFSLTIDEMTGLVIRHVYEQSLARQALLELSDDDFSLL